MDELNNKQKLGIITVILTTSLTLILIGRYWYTDYLYQKGATEFQQGLYESGIKDTKSAIDNSPTEGIYHNQMARIFTDIILGLSIKNAVEATKLIPFAVSESDIAYEANPRNMNVVETRIDIYMELAQFHPEYLQLTIDLIKNTLPFSPTDPKLELFLGKAYANMGQLKNAEIALKSALQLKPDYEEAKKDLEIIQNLPKNK